MPRRSIDNVDKKLISILQQNGRTSLSDIGKQLGMSHVAVSKRLDKLVGKKLVQVTAAVNAEALGAKVLFVGLEAESMEVADLIEKKYEHCPRLLMLAPVTGRYNLFAVMVAEDTFSLESILGTCSMRTEEGVRRSESWFGNAPVVPKYLQIDLSPKSKKIGESPCGRFCRDCSRYIADKCVGCPSSDVYKGTLWASPLTKQKRRKKKKSKS